MSIRANIIANFSGSAWATLMSVIFAPFYVKLLGVESYGIIGFYVSLAAILTILDLGLSQAMNREMALLSSAPGRERQMADTARTLELIYWAMALGVCALVALLSDFIAFYWLNPEFLSRDTLRQVFWIIAVVIGLRWPVALYSGGLNGLQRQVVVNAIIITMSTIQGVGALAVLWFIAPTLKVFFTWQVLAMFLQVVCLRIVLWRSFSRDAGGRFSFQVLRNVYRFAAGMTGVSLLSIILTQVDKVLLSRILSLSEFGFYAFATAVATVIYRLVNPVFNAYYPEFTSLVARNSQTELIRTYHKSCQVMAVAILPVSLVLVVFAPEILAVWTRNPELVESASLLLSLLVIGNAISGLMHMPYALQLSHGWTSLPIWQNIIAIIVLIPAIFFATKQWGAAGAAAAWIALNCGYLLVSAPIMFRRLLKSEKRKWYINDVAKITLVVVLACLVARHLYVAQIGDLLTIAYLAITLAITGILAVFAADRLSLRSLIGHGNRGE